MPVGTIFQHEDSKKNYLFFKDPNELKQYKVGKYYEIYIGGKYNLDMLQKCQEHAVNCGLINSLTGTVISIVNLGMLIVGGGLILYSIK